MDPHLPLNALRAFRIAAQTGGFASASRVLGVTTSAISQQVQHLETFLGKTLFVRNHNRIELTEAGREFYPLIEEHLGGLERVASDLRAAQGSRRIVISCSPSIGQLWLYPRLKAAGITDVDVLAEYNEPDMVAAGVDIRVAYGDAIHPGHKVVPLFRSALIAVAAPEVAEKCDQNLGRLGKSDFVHTVWGPVWTNDPSWSSWCKAAGLSVRPNSRHGVVVHLTAHAIAAAEAGLGVALVPEALCQNALTAGRIVQAHPFAQVMREQYCAYIPHSRKGRRQVADVLAALAG